MSNILKPCPFCGGEAELHLVPYNYYIDCKVCGAETGWWDTKEEAIEAWNNRLERIVKVIEHDASITDTDGYKYHRSEYLCGACKKKVLSGDDYCSHCGVKLDWSE